MGFIKDVAPLSGLGIASMLMIKKRKPVTPPPTMISTTPYQQPMSMIGSTRGGY